MDPVTTLRKTYYHPFYLPNLVQILSAPAKHKMALVALPLIGATDIVMNCFRCSLGNVGVFLENRHIKKLPVYAQPFPNKYYYWIRIKEKIIQLATAPFFIISIIRRITECFSYKDNEKIECKSCPKGRKGELIKVFQTTKIAARNGFKVNGKTVVLSKALEKKMQRETVVMQSLGTPLLESKKYKKTDISVVNEDCVDYALRLQRKGFHPVLLNLASARHPGGGVEKGSRAQEESIFRRSNYYRSLYPSENGNLRRQIGVLKEYTIPEFGVIYTPDVQIFRSGALGNFSFCTPKGMSMIACAAYDLNREISYFGNSLGPNFQYQEPTKQKMREVLRTAAKKGHDSVVLGALGCGAYGNSPEKISRFFKEILAENEFKGHFRRIDFAIIEDQNSGGRNFRIFQAALDRLSITA